MLSLTSKGSVESTLTSPDDTKLLLHGSNLLDYSGNDHTVTANGGATAGNSGNPFGFGGVIGLDGTGDYLSAPDSDDWDFGDTSVIDFWFTPSALGIYQNFISNRNSMDTSNWFYFRLDNTNKFRIAYYTSGSTTFEMVSDNVEVAQDVASHIAFVMSSGTPHLYVDGVEVDSTINTAYSNAPTSGNPLSIGGNPYLENEYVNGELAEFRTLKGSDNGWTGSTIEVPQAPYSIGQVVPPSEPTEVFSVTFDDDGLETAGSTTRMLMDASELTDISGTQIKVRFNSRTTADSVTIDKAYIGKQASSGNAWDFETTPVALTFDTGNTSSGAFTTSKESDYVDLATDGIDGIIVSVYCSGVFYFRKMSASGARWFTKGSTDDASTVAPSGFGTHTLERVSIDSVTTQ